MSLESTDSLLRFVIAGCLNRDYILPVSGKPQINVLGGNLAYAAEGLKLWGGTGGLIARLGEDYPMHWLDRFRALGFDLSGVKVLPDSMDARRFLAHVDPTTAFYDNPVQHFAERGLTYPPGLLGYHAKTPSISSRTTPLKQSIQISDIPDAYLEASAVHICPIDYLSHMILPSVFHQGQATTITLAPAPGYMSPSFWEEIPGLLSDITAFITPEKEVGALFQGRSTDLWEMAAILAGYGPEYILIRTTSSGYFLYDRVSEKRWVVPDYQVKVVDPTGAADAFAGGFLAGYREHYDPLEATMMGAIAVSLVVEGSGVFYALEAMPDLVNARLAALRELVREI
jgi:sugar/nucleoside kinase (ribokinase family)